MDKEKALFREVPLNRADINESDRTVELSFSSETPYYRWFGNEILSHDGGAVDLSRLSSIGVLLFNHKADTPIGSVESVWLDEAEHRCKAKVRFDSDEEAEKIYQKVIAGSLKGVSVGYKVDVWEEIERGAMSADGRFAGPCSIAKRWMPYEISIVSVPADASVGIGRTVDLQGDDYMSETTKEQEKDPVNMEAEIQRALERERTRVSEITALCRQFEFAPDEYLQGERSIEEVRKAILDRLSAERTPTPITITAEEEDKFRRAATDGLAIRAGISLHKPADGASEFRGKRMLRIAAECIERSSGKSTRNMDDEMIVREALTGSGAFAGILSNVAHKSMAQSYETAPTTYQLWTGKGTNSDFKEATRYRLSEADVLEKMTEQGEFKHSKISETSVKASIATYGRSFSITRQALINDDLGALNQIPAKYGAAARRMVNQMVYKILKDNIAIEKAALFHSSHNNLGSGALSIKTLGAAKAAMAKQTNIGGKERLNIQPAFLLVPVDLEVDAVQLISSVVDPTKSNATPNPFANKLSVIAEPELEEAAPWYLAAAPGRCPTIEVTTLNGHETPVMESAVQFDTLGIKWRIYYDVGVNLLDYRGLYKSTGV